MSDRSRRERRQTRANQTPNRASSKMARPRGESSAKWRSGWSTAAVASGLILVCIALFVFSLTARTFRFWISRDDYIRTELEVTGLRLGSGDSDSIVSGIIAATGEEIHSDRLPREFFEYDSPSDPTGTLMKPEKARGKVIPVWFAQDHKSLFSSARVQFVSEFDTLPSGTLVLGTAAVNLAIFAVGAWCVAVGIRRVQSRVIPTQVTAVL